MLHGTYIGDLPDPVRIPGASSLPGGPDGLESAGFDSSAPWSSLGASDAPHWPMPCDTTPPVPVVTCPSPEGWGARSCDWIGNGNVAANYLPREIGDQNPCNDCDSFALTNTLYAALAIGEESRTGRTWEPTFTAFSTKQLLSLPNMRFPQEQGGQSTTTVGPCPTSDKVSQLRSIAETYFPGEQFDKAFLCGYAAVQAFSDDPGFLPRDWKDTDCIVWPFTSTVKAINSDAPADSPLDGGCPNGLGHPWTMGYFVHKYMDGLCSRDDFPDFLENEPLSPCTPACSQPGKGGWMNGRGQNSECCLGRGIYNPRLFPLPDQDLCKPNARPTKCPTQQCKPKARLTKPPRLLGMRNDTTTACWARN